jgi:hypothetical protein
VFPPTAEAEWRGSRNVRFGGRETRNSRVWRLAAKYGLHLWRQSSLANVNGKKCRFERLCVIDIKFDCFVSVIFIFFYKYKFLK